MRVLVLVVCVALCVLAVQARAGRWRREGDAVVEAETGDEEVEVDPEPEVTVATTQNPNMTLQCEQYNYCNGQSFDTRVRVNERAVKCDTSPDPKTRCCLPHARHLVCYNIMVEGQHLNYDRDDFTRNTDFASLCKSMAESQGRTFGRFSGASMVAGKEGMIIYRYGHWTELEQPGTEQLQDIACEVTDYPATTAADEDTD